MDQGQQVDRRLRYRFVGGPIHNQHLYIHRDWVTVQIPEPLPIEVVDWDELIQDLKVKIHNYHKMAFRSEHQSIYYQYIHEGKFINREPSIECYYEVFPEPFHLINLFKLRGLGVIREDRR